MRFTPRNAQAAMRFALQRIGYHALRLATHRLPRFTPRDTVAAMPLRLATHACNAPYADN
ncbi:hypothetical protein GCM10020370_28830 [Paenibacillus hodogayensis]